MNTTHHPKSIMGLSLTYLSLMILFNSFFMANYLLMRALRRHMDATFRQRRSNNRNSNSDSNSNSKSDSDSRNNTNETSSPTMEERILENKILIVLLGPPLALYRKVQKMIKKYESEENDSAKRDGTLSIAIAFCFGYTRKKKYESEHFPNWDPIPYRLGAITTSTLIVLFAIVFSDTVLNKILGLDPNITSPMGGVCTDDGMHLKVDTITAKLLKETNLAAAIGQSHTTTKFLEALQEDTALWGEKYPCTTDPHTKKKFRESDSYGKDAGLYFFPGQCISAQESALATARSQTCMEEFCAIGSVVDPDSIYAENGEITGREDLQNILDDVVKSSKNLKPVCKGCPKGGWKTFEMGVGSIFGVKPKISAGIKGLDKLEANLDKAGNAIDNIDITAPTVEFGYTDEKFCGLHEVPCPDFSKYDDLTELVQDHRLAYLERFVKPEIELPIPPAETDELQEAYYDYLKRVLGQMEIASYLYAGYTCLSLFFPSPQIVFKVKFSHGIRQFLFGVGKKQFILAVLVLWWVIVYIQTFPIFAQLQLYMKVLAQDPCVARTEYVEDIGGNFTAVCNSMLSTRSNWSNTYQTINNTLELIDLMTGCCTDYPYNGESLWNFHEKYQSDLTDFGFIKNFSGACTDYDCYITIEEPTFLGNMTSCENYDFVRQEIIELNDASTISWWDVWISSGVFASLLLSPVVANYGLGLAKLADPFMVCDGKYEGPPSGFNFQESEVKTLMDELRISLKISAFGRVVIWGIVMNLLLVNVILGKMDDDDDEEFAVTVEDAIVAGFILFISVVTVFVAAKTDKLLSKRISIFEELDEKTTKGNELKEV